MDTVVVLLVLFQAAGALLGAITAVWGELAYFRAVRDGKIDTAEYEHIKRIAIGLRFGMTGMLLSSLGLVVVAYLQKAYPQPATTPGYWTLVLVSLLIVSVSWALSRKRISFARGSVVIFSAWWFLAYLSLGWLPPLTFGAMTALFVVATALFYAFLHSARFLALRRNSISPPVT